MITREDINGWKKYGKTKKATHLIVVCDTFEYEDYPVYVRKEQNVREVEKRFHGENMQQVMEIYCYKYSFDDQSHDHRTFRYE